MTQKSAAARQNKKNTGEKIHEQMRRALISLRLGREYL
jgi:hypothetical protein